ncbi:MAG: bZIP transcription factor [Tepidisphaeraceae bacterium]|jgi:hypothetical protein
MLFQKGAQMGGRYFVATVVILGLASFAIGQISVEEAQERLAARVAEDQDAATQPSGLMVSQVAALSQRIAFLTAQNEEFKKEIDDLNKEVAKLKSDAAPAPASLTVQPKSTFVSRAKDQISNSPQMSYGDQQELLANAKAADLQIDTYGARHKLAPEMIAAMHEARPLIGMPADAVSLFASVYVVSESVDGKVAEVTLKGSGVRLTISFSDDVVSEIDRPTTPPDFAAGGFGIPR